MFSHSSSSRPTLLAAVLAALLLLLVLDGAVAQGLTTLTQEDNGQVVTTSISPTVYTTSDQIFTWTPSTPPTLTPTIVSHGSVMDIKDYISAVSGTGERVATAVGAATNRELKQNVANEGEKLTSPGGWAVAGLVGALAVAGTL